MNNNGAETKAACGESLLTGGLGVGAEDMAVMRTQASALAFQWFAAREYTVSSDGHAFFLIRSDDLGLKDAALPGIRIRVSLSFERDA